MESEPLLTHTGLGHPRWATTLPYGRLHLTDFMDLWLPEETVGIDHLIYEDGSVELRIRGYQIESLLH